MPGARARAEPVGGRGVLPAGAPLAKPALQACLHTVDVACLHYNFYQKVVKQSCVAALASWGLARSVPLLCPPVLRQIDALQLPLGSPRWSAGWRLWGLIAVAWLLQVISQTLEALTVSAVARPDRGLLRQIDAHSRFSCHWDSALVGWLAAAEAASTHGAAVLSAYPPNYEVSDLYLLLCRPIPPLVSATTLNPTLLKRV